MPVAVTFFIGIVVAATNCSERNKSDIHARQFFKNGLA